MKKNIRFSLKLIRHIHALTFLLEMDLKFLSFAVLLQFCVAIWIETTHYELHNKVYRSMPVLETISNSHAHTTCITKCATLDQCSGSKFEETSMDTASTCKLIGYKTLDTTNQQMDIDNAFFKSDFRLCQGGFIQILDSCYKFISDDNDYDGKLLSITIRFNGSAVSELLPTISSITTRHYSNISQFIREWDPSGIYILFSLI